MGKLFRIFGKNKMLFGVTKLDLEVAYHLKKHGKMLEPEVLAKCRLEDKDWFPIEESHNSQHIINPEKMVDLVMYWFKIKGFEKRDFFVQKQTDGRILISEGYR